MSEPKNMVAFYVNDITSSVEFYRQLLATSPLEQSDAFAMFALPSGLLLGLWLKSTVEPKVINSGCGGELIFSFPQSADIDHQYQILQLRNVKIAQKPIKMEFGYTFLVTDPDNHRIRYFFDAGM